MLVVVRLVEAADRDFTATARCGMNELVVSDVDADMADVTTRVEENQVTNGQLFTGNFLPQLGLFTGGSG